MSKKVSEKIRELYIQENHSNLHWGKVEIAAKGTIDNIVRANEIETEIQVLETYKSMIGPANYEKIKERIKSLKKSLTHYAKMVPLIFFLCFLFSCSFPQKQYTFEVEYFNGSKDTITWTGTGENYFFLRSGDLVAYMGVRMDGPAIISGVRSFHTISIIKKAVNVPIHNN